MGEPIAVGKAPATQNSLNDISQRLCMLENKKEPKVKVADMLTAVAIIISILVAYTSWSKDRALARREQAQLIRTRTANAIEKLDHAATLTLSFYDESKLIFEKAKRSLHELDRNKQWSVANIVKVRNETFADLLAVHTKLLEEINSLGAEPVYIDQNDSGKLRREYRDALQKLKEIEQQDLEDVQGFTEDQIMSYTESKEQRAIDSCNGTPHFCAADFWHDLDEEAQYNRGGAKKKVEAAIRPLSDELEQIFSKTDDQLVPAGT
jgi:predicted nucleic acid binding AN1-type Zn finger protein